MSHPIQDKLKCVSCWILINLRIIYYLTVKQGNDRRVRDLVRFQREGRTLIWVLTFKKLVREVGLKFAFGLHMQHICK